jgi:predicted RNase H-like HicB family nuclease
MKRMPTQVSSVLMVKKQVPRDYTMTVVRDEQGWLVSDVVELPGCHTQAKTLDELIKRTKEAIQGYVKAGEFEDVPLEFIGVHRISA